jgi:hypothetical protein
VISGDLDSDGRKDLVFRNGAYHRPRDSAPITNWFPNRWQVFEERTFRGRRSDLPEPREAAVADVTGDSKNDLIVPFTIASWFIRRSSQSGAQII